MHVFITYIEYKIYFWFVSNLCMIHIYMYKKLTAYECFRFLEDLDEGIYIQQTLESVLLNDDGKQLMVFTFIITMCHIH